MKQQSNPWQVATIIGSVWGAFEVVAGSLLHNLAIPMAAGTILSALGVMIMVTGARVFGGKGIFWRSALVCAALKTVSPSPVILTPMIGITLEGLLMEFGVILLGQNLWGYILGGGLAVVSILGFKLVRLIMIYGTDLIEAYRSVFSFAFSNEFLSSKGYLIPILLIVALYLALGAFAALTGYRSGNALKENFKRKNIQIIPPNNQYKPSIVKGYKGGLGFLIFHIVWLAAFIFSKNQIPTLFWYAGGVAYIILCVFRYGRIRSLLSRPTFWLIIVMVSVLSSVFIVLGKNGTLTLSLELFQNISAIFIRASVVIISFSSISIELMSKGVTRHFRGKAFAPLASSLSSAHNSLPHLIEKLKGFRSGNLKPTPIIEGMFSQFLEETYQQVVPSVFIVTANRHAGKTTFIKEMIAFLESKNQPIYGFYSEGFWDSNGERAGFNLITLPEKKSTPLCDKISTHWQPFGSYNFNPDAIKLGFEQLENAPEGTIVFIDEIGLFELEGKIWANALTNILSRGKNPIVVSIRRTFIEDAKEKWLLEKAVIIDATVECPEKVAQFFLK